MSQFATATTNALAGTAPTVLVGTTAPSTTGITVFQDEADGKLFIDVNNMNINTNSWLVASTGQLLIELTLPTWMQGTPLQETVLSPQTDVPPIWLEKPTSGRLSISLGSVDFYAGVIIANEWGVWRENHFFVADIQADIAGEDQDPDGDGFSNRQEFIADTDPKNPKSFFVEDTNNFPQRFYWVEVSFP